MTNSSWAASLRTTFCLPSSGLCDIFLGQWLSCWTPIHEMCFKYLVLAQCCLWLHDLLNLSVPKINNNLISLGTLAQECYDKNVTHIHWQMPHKMRCENYKNKHLFTDLIKCSFHKLPQLPCASDQPSKGNYKFSGSKSESCLKLPYNPNILPDLCHLPVLINEKIHVLSQGLSPSPESKSMGQLQPQWWGIRDNNN